ncbi:MAG: YezD family protein [Ruminococcus sp.]|nr:YezD family protein [Ruminococcus sp.]
MNSKILKRSDLELLEKLLSTMKYGSVILVVQDGKIIQIERTEKYRLKD